MVRKMQDLAVMAFEVEDYVTNDEDEFWNVMELLKETGGRADFLKFNDFKNLVELIDAICEVDNLSIKEYHLIIGGLLVSMMDYMED